MRKLMNLTATLLFLVGAALVNAGEEKVPLDKVPKAVMEAVKARFKDVKVTGASKEKEEGKILYEITFKIDRRNVDVTLTPEGQIVLIEKEIAAKDLPKAVVK